MDTAVPPPLLLVDGYNMIGAWKVFQPKGNRQASIFSNPTALEAARRRLVESLVDYTAFQGYLTQIIFDAQFRQGIGNSEQITQQLMVHFTEAGETADSYIERICAFSRQERQASRQRIIVATSDHTHKLTVIGYGAEWMSAQRLAGDVQMVVHLIRQKRQSAVKAPRANLAQRLDPTAKQRLERLRFPDSWLE